MDETISSDFCSALFCLAGPFLYQYPICMWAIIIQGEATGDDKAIGLKMAYSI